MDEFHDSAFHYKRPHHLRELNVCFESIQAVKIPHTPALQLIALRATSILNEVVKESRLIAHATHVPAALRSFRIALLRLF